MSNPYKMAESEVESAALAWLESLGWQIKHGPEIAPGEPFAERDDYRKPFLPQRLKDALARLNPELPVEALDEAFRKLVNPPGATLEARNRAFHRMLVDGVTVEYRREDGSIAGAQARVIDFDDPENNDFLAVNQFTVTEGRHTRRPDIVLFVNGLPLVIIELKNPADEEATIWTAYQQLQTYKVELSTLFTFNELLVISDGLEARMGTLTAGREWFKPWRTISGERVEDEGVPQLEVLLKGVFEPGRFLELIRDFMVYEDDGGRLTKKVAGYHQFHAVRVAVRETLRAAALTQDEGLRVREEIGRYEVRGQGGRPGDRRIGVVWHTQGSGKSLTMVFYAGRIIREPAMQNPTVVVLTDRNDLDDQLFGVFSRCQELLCQEPIQAKSRAHLRELLSREAGGIIFTTIQKFFPDEKGDRHPLLSLRRNIVVMADEAHRSQYDFIDGFARHIRDALPNASFIAFTGTPIELEDRNTRAVFGDYISIYDIQRAVEDGATVPIYYESRLAKLALPEELKPKIDEEFEEVTEREEVERKEKLKTKWAQLEAVVGAEPRLRMIAEDIVKHFERRLEALDGKGMIVCMSRRICVDLYHQIIRLRPEWHHEDDDKGVIKVIMTGSASDPPEWQPHIRNKERREFLARRFRDPNDPLRLVIVRDMWLTGFDCPSLHTMYIDKPMRGHGLMQAIARVNRVFRDKPGGLVVDYIGLARELKQALAVYTESGGRGRTALDQEEAVAVMQEKYEICCDLFHGFDWSAWKTGAPEERLALLPAAQEHILAQPDGKERFVKAVLELSKAFALAVPHEEALRIRDDVAFFQAVRSALVKRSPSDARPEEELDHALRQLVDRAVAPEGVVDIFAAAGLKKPDISILSEEFLAEVRDMPQKNLAVELLRKLLQGEIRTRRRKNVVQARRFSEMLERAVRRYQNRAIEAAQVIEELIALAREMREADRRGEELGLSEEEVAFYDALAANESAVEVLGDKTLRQIAQELVRLVRENVTVDWAQRENVRAYLRVLVKRTLRKYGYPPDKQEEATQTVLKQAEVLSEEWVKMNP
ncbi:Type I restriction-modification system, restriction subunit R [Thermosulfurimonas dismutans]|uniref:Type I restriction enzyme endonuclease subunit n=2 Tax=Thermosulfurimonas dismutans TaxID=999894 RepID=A0A179D3Z0_9BACT|nr:type I restriction endonuclease subunit R [Thermosulfurimonas dismutans]OAQ20790.1 Type I restriction-modification system, restriction subunit R [Thermosulfurimonas dismutans]